MMNIFEAPEVPLQMDEDNVIRVGGTRVTLSTVVHAFNHGYTAEEIVTDFSALKLADVYAVIAYILNNSDAVAAYVAEQDRAAEAIRQEVEARSDSAEFRRRLLSRAQAAGPAASQ